MTTENNSSPIAIIDYGMGNLRSRAKGLREGRSCGRRDRRPGRRGPGRQGRPAGRGRLRGRDWRTAAAAISSARCWTRSNRANLFWESAWACNCCSTWATKTAATRDCGVLRGEVVRFDLPQGFSVPHMGWNQFDFARCAARAARHRAGHLRLLRPLLLRRSARRRRHRHDHRLRRAVLLDGLARQHLRQPVPPGKEPVATV